MAVRALRHPFFPGVGKGFQMQRDFLAMRQPRVLAERCVHAVCPGASCRACVTACPQEAWVFTHESLGLNTRTCDGCQRCEPVCPTGAIGFVEPVTAAPGVWQGEKALYLHCEMSDVPVGAEGRVPCLHGVGVGAVVAWSAEGVQTLLTASGPCSDCHRNRGDGPLLATTVAQAALLNRSRGQAALAQVALDAVAWQRARVENPPRKPPAPVVGRRGFFRLSVQAVADEASKLSAVVRPETSEAEERVFIPAGRRLAAVDGETAADAACHLWVPELDSRRCTGCHACVRICPFAALSFIPATAPEPGEEGRPVSAPGPAYGIDPAGCTGCGLCRDVCETGAITLHGLARQTQQILELHEGRCRACGTVVHVPQTAAGDFLADGLCRVCRRNNPYRNLFQVLP